MAEVVAASAAVKILISLVKDGITELGNLGWKAEEKLTDLHHNLKLIETYLQNTEKTPNHEVVGDWLKQLQDIIAKVRPEVKELVDQITNKRKTLEGLIPVIMSTYDSVKLGHKVGSINEKLDKIIKRGTNLGLQNRVTFGSASSSSVKETGPFLEDPALVIPRDADVSKVVDMLINCSSTNRWQSLPVVSIVGMAGLGKTTLAKMVLKDHRLKSLVEKRRQLWVCVSATFDVDRILCQILEVLTGHPAASFEKLKTQTIVAKIKKLLKGKSFLLVLDDVWNEDTKKWDQLMAYLLGIPDNDKSIILATTRSQKAVLAMRSPQEFTHQISMLDDDQCWSIIKAKSFGESCVPHNFEVTGKEIGKKCKGVALVASVIGGTMQTERTEDAWSLIKKSNLWNSLESDEQTISVLRLSYDRLGSVSLKKCFEFCSIFPENSVLYREELIKFWMAAGFLDSSPPNDQCSHKWDLGNKNFNIFVSNSLFQDVVRDKYGNIIRCKMHDLLRRLARSLSKVMGPTSDANSSENVSSILHLNIIGAKGEQVESLIKCNALKLLQSLFCEIDTFKRISGECKELKILKLVGPGNELPSSVGDLKDLRYFDVSKTNIEELPKSIAKLKKLQTLNVRGCRRLGKLPDEMEKFVELSHLDFDQHKLMPVNIGSFKSLRKLPFGFPAGVTKGREIGELEGLSHLQGTLTVHGLQRVKGEEKAREAKLNEKEGICELILVWNWNERKESERKEQDEGVLKGLQPHKKLKGLRITAYTGKKFPTTWLPSRAMKNSEPSLPNLIDLHLTWCINCEKLPSLGHLPNLTYLHLHCLSSVKSIDTDFYGGGNFPSLKIFTIHGMESLEEWVETTEKNMFPSLERFCLAKCHKLRSCKLLTDGLPSLYQLSISQCSNLTSISLTKGYPRLKKFGVYDCKQISCICLEDGLPSLEELICNNCPQLEKIHLFKKGLPRLQRMIIQDCEKLSHIGDGLSSCKCLRKIEIERCNNLEFLPSFHELQSLKNLTLLWCKLLHAPKDLQCCTALQKLTLEFCPNMFPRPDSSVGTSNLMSLSPLEALRKLMCFMLSPRVSPEGSFPLFDSIPSSLKALILRGNYGDSISRFRTLPLHKEQRSALKNLKKQHISGTQTSPECLQDSSLNLLQIYDCPDLPNLPNLSNIKLLVKRRNGHGSTPEDFELAVVTGRDFSHLAVTIE